MRRLLLLAILVALLVLPGVVSAGESRLSGGTPAIGWWTFASGGGRRVASGALALTGVVGQPVLGQVDGTSSALCAGFLCGASGLFRVYLPLLLRAYP